MKDFFQYRESLTEAKKKSVYRDELQQFDDLSGLNVLDGSHFRDSPKDLELTFQEVQKINASSVKKMSSSQKSKTLKTLKQDEDWLKWAEIEIDDYQKQNWDNMESSDRKVLKKFMSTFSKHRKLILNKIKILGK